MNTHKTCDIHGDSTYAIFVPFKIPIFSIFQIHDVEVLISHNKTQTVFITFNFFYFFFSNLMFTSCLINTRNAFTTRICFWKMFFVKNQFGIIWPMKVRKLLWSYGLTARIGQVENEIN